MDRTEIKELFVILILFAVNIGIAYFITNLLGVTNTVIMKSYTALGGDITWEIIIVYALLFVESIIIDARDENSWIRQNILN